MALALDAGGVIVLHEYFDYGTWRAVPPCRELDEFVSAVMTSWRKTGGEPDIARQLPSWLEELQFEIRQVVQLLTSSNRTPCSGRGSERLSMSGGGG